MNPNGSSSPMGGFYHMKSEATCERQGIEYWRPFGNAEGHMVVVITNPDDQNVVVVVTITTKNHDPRVEYIPISPTPQGSYKNRLQIQGYENNTTHPALSKHSYLRVDPFTMPFEQLDKAAARREVKVDTLYRDDHERWDPDQLLDANWRPRTYTDRDYLRHDDQLEKESLTISTSYGHFYLTTGSLQVVVDRLRVLWNRRCWDSPVPGVTITDAGNGRRRLANRMGWSVKELEERMERHESWLRRRTE